MARNFYILAGALLFFSLVSFGMSWTHGAHEPGMPGEPELWRTMALFFFLGSAVVCLVGTVTNMFEQASRRHEEREARNRHRRPPGA